MIINGVKPFVRVSQLNPQCLAGRRTLVNLPTLGRVPVLYTLSSIAGESRIQRSSDSRTFISRRTYADKPVSRPKAHTGRTTTSARRAPTTAATKAAKKPAPRTKAPKAIPKAKATGKPKTKKKATTKSKPKKKAAVKAKPKKKKVPSQRQVDLKAKQKQRDIIKKLKETALVPPKRGMVTAWGVCRNEVQQTKAPTDKTAAPGIAQRAASTYKDLTPEQLEQYNHTANQNQANYNKEYREWIESHTPDQIRLANLARQRLNKMGQKPTLRSLKDDRQVKSLRTSFNLFHYERYQTGDFKGMKIAEAARLIGREWKALSESERKPFKDMKEKDRVRYYQERKTVYNKDPFNQKKEKAVA